MNSVVRSAQVAARTMTSVAGQGSQRLANRVAVLTASTDGIGLAIAKRMVEEGAKVVVSSRKIEKVHAAVEEIKKMGTEDVIGLPAHMGSQKDRELLVSEAGKRFGGIDILVHCAGVNPSPGHPMDCTSESFDKMYEVNMKSAFEMTKLVRPYFHKRNGGVITLMATVSAYHSQNLNLGMYSVTKGSLLVMTKSLASALATENIRVNSLCPGLIDTAFATSLHGNPKLLKSLLARIPMGRMGKAEEMAGLVTFLSTDEASYLTGENIVIGGGTGSHL